MKTLFAKEQPRPKVAPAIIKDNITIIAYNKRCNFPCSLTINHGDEYPLGTVAVVAGKLHKPGECKWCDNLRARCNEMRVY